jgi:hypothetical protein
MKHLSAGARRRILAILISALPFLVAACNGGNGGSNY